MESAVTFRRMEMEDLDQIMIIEHESFTIPWSKEAFYNELTKNNHALYIVAVVGEQVVGYCGVWLVLDEAHVTNIAILPQYRGKKIGESLMGTVIETVKERGARTMTLEVRASNVIAQSLYRKFGFQTGGLRKGYYSDNHEDALVMWVNF
ncbi:ribosomal protein S18-alanine N-acetyltransferase [Niallia sp. Krafla_26]|uniref:ribosomal protein S18-alanine N-acetyltransferase n=1 Tax=Niallia sp. Krafla_26 TaxID=3064703 RepID=UPI003D186EFF